MTYGSPGLTLIQFSCDGSISGIRELDLKRPVLLQIVNKDEPRIRINVYNSGIKIEIMAEGTILIIYKVFNMWYQSRIFCRIFVSFRFSFDSSFH